MNFSPISLLPRSFRSTLPDSIQVKNFGHRPYDGSVSRSVIGKILTKVVAVAGTVFSTWLTVQIFEIAKIKSILYFNPQNATPYSNPLSLPIQNTTQPDYRFIDLPRIANTFNSGLGYGLGGLIPSLILGSVLLKQYANLASSLNI